jgi:hypothetical protein
LPRMPSIDRRLSRLLLRLRKIYMHGLSQKDTQKPMQSKPLLYCHNKNQNPRTQSQSDRLRHRHKTKSRIRHQKNHHKNLVLLTQ